MKYSDLLVDWLVELGYTHCFFVAGGNIMHLVESVRSRMVCVAVIHEVAAGAAAEAFNEASSRERAFALVTAGPGLTNIVTAVAAAWLESRELLIIGGQVKTSDSAGELLRQRGIQEINGIDIVAPISVSSTAITRPCSKSTFSGLVHRGRVGRRGPVFIEIPLDVQAATVDKSDYEAPDPAPMQHASTKTLPEAFPNYDDIATLAVQAQRPVLLVGGGVSRTTAARLQTVIEESGLAVMTTWNGCDRIGAGAANYFGRPNTWGMRYSNVLLQQADLILAVGTRLGLQQTGFNWRAFAPKAKVVQVDLDEAELSKGHPHVEYPMVVDADDFLEELLGRPLGDHAEWLAFCRMVKDVLPVAELCNVTGPGYVDPYLFALQLSGVCSAGDTIIPCSSGGTYTTMMQAFAQKNGQIFISDKGLASMGYGLPLALGAAFAHRDRRTILTEGDGGFCQNLQELATVSVNNLNLKIFIHSNEGYASIRMTQKNYFGGNYLGCDVKTGLGFPKWPKLFDAYEIPFLALDERGTGTPGFTELITQAGPAAFVVPVDPSQTYYPKVSSRVTADGSMESAPIHLMSPDLDEITQHEVLRYLES